MLCVPTMQTPPVFDQPLILIQVWSKLDHMTSQYRRNVPMIDRGVAFAQAWFSSTGR